MKVVIFSNYGGRIPKLLKRFVKPNGVNWRCGEIVSFIEQAAVNVNVLQGTEANVHVVAYQQVENQSLYLFTEEKLTVTIIDVDVTRPWTIATYDGAEYIQYLDYVVVNEDINYCKYKN